MDPTKKELYTAKRSSGVDLSDPAISSSWELVRSDEDPANWVVLFLSSASTVAVKETGTGIEEMISRVSDDDMLFGAFRVRIVGLTKFFHFLFIGANVSAIKKSKATMYESGIFQVRIQSCFLIALICSLIFSPCLKGLEGAHGKIKLSGLEELTIENIHAQIALVSRVEASAIEFC